MDLQLKDDQLDKIIAKAILDTLSDKTREELVINAVKDLIQTPKDTTMHGDKKSVLQRAFAQAVSRVAEEIIRKQLEEDSMFKFKVKQLLTDISEELFDNKEKRQTIIEKMVNTIIKGLDQDRY